MLNLRENFFATGSAVTPVTSVTASPAPPGPQVSDTAYKTLLDGLKTSIENNDSKNIKIYETQIQDFIQNYYNVIKQEQESILQKEEETLPISDIINDDREKKLLEEGENVLQQKLTYLKKYENIKSTELSDKKNFTILIIINVLVLLILVYGCYLMLTDKTLDLGFLRVKKSSRNNNSNSNSLNGL